MRAQIHRVETKSGPPCEDRRLADGGLKNLQTLPSQEVSQKSVAYIAEARILRWIGLAAGENAMAACILRISSKELVLGCSYSGRRG